MFITRGWFLVQLGWPSLEFSGRLPQSEVKRRTYRNKLKESTCLYCSLFGCSLLKVCSGGWGVLWYVVVCPFFFFAVFWGSTFFFFHSHFRAGTTPGPPGRAARRATSSQVKPRWGLRDAMPTLKNPLKNPWEGDSKLCNFYQG